MPKITTYSKTVTSCNILTVAVGTNCPQGGDTGHGGRTTLSLTDDASTDIRVRVNGQPEQEVESIELILGGDCEADAFLECLEFAVDVLKSQMATNGKKPTEVDIP